MRCTAEQFATLDALDRALCNFLNGASDPYTPELWHAETERNFEALRDAYNECHKTKVFDWDRRRKKTPGSAEANPGS